MFNLVLRQEPVSTFALMFIQRLATGIKAQSSLRTPKFCMECGDSAPLFQVAIPCRISLISAALAPCYLRLVLCLSPFGGGVCIATGVDDLLAFSRNSLLFIVFYPLCFILDLRHPPDSAHARSACTLFLACPERGMSLFLCTRYYSLFTAFFMLYSCSLFLEP